MSVVTGLAILTIAGSTIAVAPVATATAPGTIAAESVAPPADSGDRDSSAPTSRPAAPSGATETTLLDNEFIPENVNVGDCVSALPRPECGSEERGGWRQSLVLVAVVAGLGVIGWRMVAAMRRRPRA